MQSNVASRTQPAEEGSMLPCSVCGTYSKRAKFYSYVEPKCSQAKLTLRGAEADGSALPPDSESFSPDFGFSSDSDDACERSRSGATTQREDAASSPAIDSQATVIVSQSQSCLTSPHKRAAAAIQPRVICRRCRVNPRDPSSLSEDLVGRHSSWGNVSPFYFDLHAAAAALSNAPALQLLPPELALSAGHIRRNKGRPQQKSVTSRVMPCALQHSIHNAAAASRRGSRPSFKTFLIRRLTFAAWSALTRSDWASAEALACALEPARMSVADVLWKTGLEVLRRNPAKDSQRRRFAQMCIGFTQGPLKSAVLDQHVVDTVIYSASAEVALAELRRFTVGTSISASPVLHYAIACSALAVAATAKTDLEGYEILRVEEAWKTALDAATRLLQVAPASAQSHVTMWHVLKACGRARDAAAVIEAALAATSPLHMHPSLLHIAVSDCDVSRAVARSSAIYLLELDPCHPAPAACIAAALADGHMALPAAAEALAACLDTPTPLHASTWETVSLVLAQLMWGWQAAAISDWLGWRFVWWPRLHLSNAERQISLATSPDERQIVACKALLALLLQGPSSGFRCAFVRSCNGWPAAAWLQQAELRCSEMESDSDLSASESVTDSRALRGVGTTTNNPITITSSSADTSGQDEAESSDPAAAGFRYSDNYSDSDETSD
jgi:hypothetical protein